MSEYDGLKFLPRNVDTCFFQQKALSVALSFFVCHQDVKIWHKQKQRLRSFPGNCWKICWELTWISSHLLVGTPSIILTHAWWILKTVDACIHGYPCRFSSTIWLPARRFSHLWYFSSSLGGLGFPFLEKTEMCDMHGRLEYVHGMTLQHICNTLDANQGYCLFHYLSKIWVL